MYLKKCPTVVKSLSIKKVSHLRIFLKFTVLLIFCLGKILSLNSCTTQNDTHISVDNLKQLRSRDTTLQKLYFLEMEEKFWQNRITMAQDESIDLVLDLVDSKVILEVKGVPLRITSYTILKRDLRKFGRELAEWCASPFTLIREEASLPKQPIRIRRLPEETSKIEEGYNLEFLDETESAFVRLYFNRALVVELIEEDISIPDSLIKSEVNLNWIQFTMKREDVIAIFRALPENTEMVLRPPKSLF